MYQLSKDGLLSQEEKEILEALKKLENFDVDLLSQDGLEVYYNMADRAHELETGELLEVNDYDREAIAEHVKQGNTSGILDGEDYRISWHIDMEKFEN